MKRRQGILYIVFFCVTNLAAQVGETPQENIEVTEAQSNFYNDNLASTLLDNKNFKFAVSSLDRQKLSRD